MVKLAESQGQEVEVESGRASVRQTDQVAASTIGSVSRVASLSQVYPDHHIEEVEFS